MRFGGIAVVALVLAAMPPVAGAAGPGFDRRGIEQVAVQPDGSIYAAGYRQRCIDGDLLDCDAAGAFVARLTADGRIDRTYGDNGRAELPATLAGDLIDAIALQGNGRLVLAVADEDDSSLLRLDPDGSLDTEFGDGGRVMTSNDAYLADGGSEGLAVGPDDKLYVSEHSRDEEDRSYAVARYDASGAPDPSFAGGRAVADLGAASGAGRTSGLAVRDDGAVTVIGSVFSYPTDWHLLAARFDPDGALDLGFGKGGVVDLFVPKTGIGDLIPLDDGGTAILGPRSDPDSFHECCSASLFAVDGSGALGTSFTHAGIQRLSSGAIARAPDGEVLLAGTEDVPYGGSGPMRIRVSRYRLSGELDRPFSGDGTTAVRIGGLRSTATSVAPGPGGTVLVGGSVRSEHCNPTDANPAGSPCDSAVVIRFRRDGSLDPSFGRGGVAGLPRFSFCPAMPTTRCGFDLDRDEFVVAMVDAVSRRARIDGRRLTVRSQCPAVVAAPCRFRFNASARKQDRLGARARTVTTKPGRVRIATLRLQRPVARRVVRNGSAIVWSVTRASSQPAAARTLTRVAITNRDRGHR